MHESRMQVGGAGNRQWGTTGVGDKWGEAT